MISGIHAIIYSKQADRLREFFRDVLKLPSVDAGHGWLIFALPPAELAVHPEEESYHELYLMCDDIQSTTDLLKAKKVELVTPIADRGWGLVTRLRLPSGDEIWLLSAEASNRNRAHQTPKAPEKCGSAPQDSLLIYRSSKAQVSPNRLIPHRGKGAYNKLGVRYCGFSDVRIGAERVQFRPLFRIRYAAVKSGTGNLPDPHSWALRHISQRC